MPGASTTAAELPSCPRLNESLPIARSCLRLTYRQFTLTTWSCGCATWYGSDSIRCRRRGDALDLRRSPCGSRVAAAPCRGGWSGAPTVLAVPSDIADMQMLLSTFVRRPRGETPPHVPLPVPPLLRPATDTAGGGKRPPSMHRTGPYYILLFQGWGMGMGVGGGGVYGVGHRAPNSRLTRSVRRVCVHTKAKAGRRRVVGCVWYGVGLFPNLFLLFLFFFFASRGALTRGQNLEVWRTVLGGMWEGGVYTDMVYNG